MRALLSLALIVLVGAMWLAREDSAAARSAASTTVDRTFVCAPSLVGGVWQIGARTRRGSGKHGAAWDRPPIAAISTTVAGAAAIAIEDELVWLTAGAPSAQATVISTFAGFTFPVRTWGTLGVNAKRCRGTSARVPLGRNGLEGGSAAPIEERYDCETTKRVVVHIRAVLRSRVSLTGYRGFLRTTAPIRQASVAVRAQSGRPLVYAGLEDSGKASLYRAAIPRCTPD